MTRKQKNFSKVLDQYNAGVQQRREQLIRAAIDTNPCADVASLRELAEREGNMGLGRVVDAMKLAAQYTNKA